MESFIKSIVKKILLISILIVSFQALFSQDYFNEFDWPIRIIYQSDTIDIIPGDTSNIFSNHGINIDSLLTSHFSLNDSTVNYITSGDSLLTLEYWRLQTSDTSLVTLNEFGTTLNYADSMYLEFGIIDDSLRINGSAIINHDKNSTGDFRIKGDVESNLFFVDYSTNAIGIANNTPATILGWSATDDRTIFNVKNLNSKQARLAIQGTLAAFDFIDLGATADQRWLSFFNQNGLYKINSLNDAATFNKESMMTIELNTGVITFNENGYSTSDIRIEGDTEVNLFFTDASADMIGIGTNTPSYELDVTGDINTTTNSLYFSGSKYIYGDEANHIISIGGGVTTSTTADYSIFIGDSVAKNGTDVINSVLIGYEAGEASTTGHSHVLIGSQAGRSITNLNGNVYIGYQAGINSAFGGNVLIGAYVGGTGNITTKNTFVGYQAAGSYGGSNSHSNTILGYRAGYQVESSSNVFIGSLSGEDCTGYSNTFVGASSGVNVVAGYSNTFIGNIAGAGNLSGHENVMIGVSAGAAATNDRNVFVGFQAGSGNTGYNNVLLGYGAGFTGDGNANVFIGFASGYNETGSNKLYIDNSNTTSPLIYGEFDNNIVKINGTQVQATNTIAADDVTPDISASNVWTTSANTGTTVITDFDNPDVGSVIYIIGGSDTNSSTIADGGNFNLSAAWTASLDDILILFIQADNDYIEISRSNN